MYDVVCTVFGGHKMFDVRVCCSCFKDGGLACFEIALPIFLLPVHGVKLDVNSHLTTPTQHVMVGITRSKVYNFFGGGRSDSWSGAALSETASFAQYFGRFSVFCVLYTN